MSKEVQDKLAWRRADLKKEAKAKREELSKQDPLKRYGEKQQRLAKETDDSVPKKKVASTWQWDAQLISSVQMEARRKVDLTPAKSWKQQPYQIWKPALRSERGEKPPSGSNKPSSSTNKGASSWKPKS